MSEEFIRRVARNQLTNVDQYRRMRASLGEIKSESKESSGDTEEWKKWQLAPVSAGGDNNNDPALVDPLSESAQGLHQAIKVLDRK